MTSLVETAAEDALSVAAPELALPLRILGWFKGAGAAIARGARWAVSSWLHAALLVIVVLLIIIGVVIHQRDTARAALPFWQGLFNRERVSLISWRRDDQQARAGLTTCNGSIVAAQRLGDAAHAAQQRALGAVVASDAQRAADQAAFARAALVPPVAGSCAMPALIIDRENTL